MWMKKLKILIIIIVAFLCSCSAQNIKTTYVNGEGHLIVRYDDNTEKDLGLVTGKDGRDGVDGKDGLDGKNGKDGINGLNGKDGKDGRDGKDGIDGKDGVDGVDGKDGANGVNGLDGAVIYLDKHIKLSSPKKYNEICQAGTHFDYLLVWNASNNTAGGCYNSYVLPYEYEDLPANAYNYMRVTNYSCYNYKEGEDYSKYIVNCTNRTAPGRYKDPDTGAEMDWEKATYGIGVYILVNANIYSCHQSTMCNYGGVPVSQVLIVYDEALTPLQFIERM